MRISITTTLAAVLLASLSAGVDGFVSQLPASRARPLQRRGSLSMSDSSVQDKATQVGNTLLGYVTGAVEAAKNLDSDKAQDQLSEWGKKVSGNVVDSLDLEKEGELYALPPLLLMLLILYGHVPFVGPIAELLAGPGLVAVGATFFAAGIYELGSSLSPWPQPVKDGALKTEGIFSLVRHPMYGGLVIGSLGLAVATAEFERALLTVLLVLALDKKIEFEEKYMSQAFPEYTSYKSKVTKKFIPFVY